MSVVRPAMLMLTMMNGNTGVGFKCRHSKSFTVIGVINRIVVTLSKNTEMNALMMHNVEINRQMLPLLTFGIERIE